MYSFILICVCLFNIYRGYAKGFIFKLLEFVVMLASVLIAIPAGRYLALHFPLLSGFTGYEYMDYYVNQFLWFLLLEIGLRLLAALIYKVVKWLHKIKIFGFCDRILGMLLASLTTLITLCILVVLLQMPFIHNGPEFIEDSWLRHVRNFMDTNIIPGLEDYYA